MSLTPFTLLKGTTSLAVGTGVMKIVCRIVDAQVIPTSNYQKVVIWCGKIGIGLTAAAIVEKHIKNQFDEINKIYHEAEDDFKQAMKETKK